MRTISKFILVTTLLAPNFAFATESEGSCIQDTYERERARNVDHDTALDHAKEVCHAAATAS